ncbi:MAG: succinate--CoA ligase subunit alpha [Methanomassiliicoccales archaeon]|nr:MAG: succinate--CoA ligase subunit alpha [Methanomassiliicoccales archaeon]
MSILVNQNTKVIIQGITGHQGTFHAKAMLDFGTKVVGGVTPGKGGSEVHGVPVFDGVRESVEETGANASMVLVPAPFAMDACFEALDAGIELLVLITERIPFHDAMRIMSYAKSKDAHVIGPNTPGIISPGLCKIGIMPSHIFKKGNVGILSRSGTLTYEIVSWITESGLGQSTCMGIGGDPIIGITFIDGMELMEEDDDTEAVVLVGEIGGTAEEDAAEYVPSMKKKVYAYIAGQTAPAEKRMGHAGAIISRGKGTAESKIKAFDKVGVPVASLPSDIPKLITG